MKPILLLPFLLLPLPALAGTQAAADSIAVDSIAADSVAADRISDLEELVVEGRTQRVIKYGVEYTPDKRTKKLAMSATNLLQLMAIPQLDISPDGAVKLIGDRDVKIFIDYIPATEQDLAGMRTQDVMRVEVLEYPQDPRFESAQYVINYIMHQYEWGGYTTISAFGRVLQDLSGSGDVYSKFVRKRWTFDASVGGDSQRIDKTKGVATSTFRDFEFDSQPIDLLDRTSVTDAGLYQRYSQWASLRAMYNTDKMGIEHKVSFFRNDTPDNSTDAHVFFSEDLLPSSRSRRAEETLTLSPSIYGRYYFLMPKENTLVLNWNFSYGHTRRNSSYRLGDIDPIINDNRERVYTPNANLSYSKGLGHNNTFRTSLMTYTSIYDTRYAGSYVDRQKLVSSENMLFLEYMQNWSIGLSLYSRVGASYVIGRVNGVNTLEQWNPRLGMQLQYQINSRHSASISAWWGNSHPGPAASNTAIVQSDELMWLMGNPGLRNTIFQMVDVSYNFIPTDKLSFSFYAQYEGNPHKQAYEYMVLPGYNGLVRRTINSGTAHDWTGVISGSLKLLDKSLNLTASVKGNRVVLTGVDAQSLNDLRGSVNVNYFLGNFSFSANYSTPAKYLGAWSFGQVTRVKESSYGLSVNYAVGELKMSLGSSNWFNKGRSYADFDSERYAMHSWEWNMGSAPEIHMRVSYTFPYGKKVNRNNELGGASSVGSAILK